MNDVRIVTQCDATVDLLRMSGDSTCFQTAVVGRWGFKIAEGKIRKRGDYYRAY